jgi:hypothetical protein
VRLWGVKNIILLLLGYVPLLLGAPTEIRDWTASGGQKARGSAMEMQGGKVILKLESGKTVAVPLEKLSEGDRTFLTAHFRGAAATPAAAGEAADDLPYPLGKTTGEIDCGGGFHCFLYFPASLRKGAKHPVVYIMDPGGGSPGIAGRYIPGAERNRWIIAVSKESRNKLEPSYEPTDAMIKHVREKLPIDHDRQYVSGMSGGSREAFLATQRHKDIAGIIACGAGGSLGSGRQLAYGLCGSNCFNRTDMANSFKQIKSKGSVLRYFIGRHDWASAELCDDAMTHLNGVFLAKHKSDYADDYACFNGQVGKIITENQSSNPNRAYMWACFIREYGYDNPAASSAIADLGKDPKNLLFVKGLTDVSEFAQKTFGQISVTQWQADPKVSAACLREATKYTGSIWENVLTKMAEDAQEF